MKMISENIKTILSNTYTNHDMKRRIGFLEEFLVYKNFGVHEQYTEFCIPMFFKEIKKEKTEEARILFEWGEEFYARFEKGGGENILKQIKKEAEELPVITIYFPASFSQKELKDIGVWLRKNVDISILMEVFVDKNMIGGCGFIWNNTYHDFSFRNFVARHTNELQLMLNEYDIQR